MGINAPPTALAAFAQIDTVEISGATANIAGKHVAADLTIVDTVAQQFDSS